MSFKKFLFSRTFLANLVLAVMLIFILLYATMQGLKIYTHHNQSFAVPDFEGKSLTDVKKMATQSKLNYVVVDSVHVKDALPGVVIDQVPEKGFKVKENRTIFLTINTMRPEMIKAPKLTDISFRQARVLIENNGLFTGQIIYEPSEYNDLVLKALIDSTEILEGQEIVKGSQVDLIVGRNNGNELTPLPDLNGLTLTEANEVLTNAMLNTGVVIYDPIIETAEDSANAVVWKQHPEPLASKNITLGSLVDLWITTDTLKLKKDPIF